MSGRGIQVARLTAVAVIVAQLVSVGSWLIAGELGHDYSFWRQGVSDLGAATARHPWLVDGALLVLGVSIAATAFALRVVLRDRRTYPAVAVLFVVAGLGLVLTGLLRADCQLSSHACQVRFNAGQLSWHTLAHVWAAIVATVAIVLTPFALARALWPSPVGAAALAAGVFGVGVGVVTGVLARATALRGVAEQSELLTASVWLGLVAGGLLYATRRGVKVMPLTKLRSGAFFAGSWAGEGELTAWPPLLGRMIRSGFNFTREARFLSEDIWIFDDRATFRDGKVLAQRLICQLEATGRIHVTGDSVPGGCEVLLHDQGYQLTPYRYLVELGPLHVTLRCRDEHRVEPDGRLVSTITARWLGIPLVRLQARGRRTDTAEPGRGLGIERLLRAAT